MKNVLLKQSLKRDLLGFWLNMWWPGNIAQLNKTRTATRSCRTQKRAAHFISIRQVSFDAATLWRSGTCGPAAAATAAGCTALVNLLIKNGELCILGRKQLPFSCLFNLNRNSEVRVELQFIGDRSSILGIIVTPSRKLRAKMTKKYAKNY